MTTNISPEKDGNPHIVVAGAGIVGASIAFHLARRGARVELVTPERMVGISVGAMNSPAYLRAFAEHGVSIQTVRQEGRGDDAQTLNGAR